MLNRNALSAYMPHYFTSLLSKIDSFTPYGDLVKYDWYHFTFKET